MKLLNVRLMLEYLSNNIPFINVNKKVSLTEEQKLKRNNIIKEMLLDAIAIRNNQIEIHTGCMKMDYLKSEVDEILYFDLIDLEIFEKYIDEFHFFPIEEEREKYNKEYLRKLDAKLYLIDQKYKDLIFKKCDEIVEILSPNFSSSIQK